jgi:hypothetical protein
MQGWVRRLASGSGLDATEMLVVYSARILAKTEPADAEQLQSSVVHDLGVQGRPYRRRRRGGGRRRRVDLTKEEEDDCLLFLFPK